MLNSKVQINANHMRKKALNLDLIGFKVTTCAFTSRRARGAGKACQRQSSPHDTMRLLELIFFICTETV